MRKIRDESVALNHVIQALFTAQYLILGGKHLKLTNLPLVDYLKISLCYLARLRHHTPQIIVV